MLSLFENETKRIGLFDVSDNYADGCWYSIPEGIEGPFSIIYSKKYDYFCIFEIERNEDIGAIVFKLTSDGECEVVANIPRFSCDELTNCEFLENNQLLLFDYNLLYIIDINTSEVISRKTYNKKNYFISVKDSNNIALYNKINNLLSNNDEIIDFNGKIHNIESKFCITIEYDSKLNILICFLDRTYNTLEIYKYYSYDDVLRLLNRIDVPQISLLEKWHSSIYSEKFLYMECLYAHFSCVFDLESNNHYIFDCSIYSISESGICIQYYNDLYKIVNIKNNTLITTYDTSEVEAINISDSVACLW